LSPSAVIDAGPLVALLNARDRHHAWVVRTLQQLTGPLLTCEAVVSDALFLTSRYGDGSRKVAHLLTRGGLRIGLSLEQEADAVCRLLAKYADVPMSLADACLVRLSEKYPRLNVMTFDAHFLVYRRHQNQTVPLLRPT
jgi:uncharacterized protein